MEETAVVVSVEFYNLKTYLRKEFAAICEGHAFSVLTKEKTQRITVFTHS